MGQNILSGPNMYICDRYFLAKNDGPYCVYGVSRLLFVARTNMKMKWQRKVGFGPIEANAEVGPALPIAICCENGDAMLELTGISRPA